MSIIGHAEAFDIATSPTPSTTSAGTAPLPEALSGLAGHGDEKKRKDLYVKMQEMLGRRGARGLALHAPATGGHQEGRDRHLEDLPLPVLDLSEVACRSDRSPRGEVVAAIHCPPRRRARRHPRVRLAPRLAVVRVLPGDPALIILGLEANRTRWRGTAGARSRPLHAGPVSRSGWARRSAGIWAARSSTTCRSRPSS